MKKFFRILFDTAWGPAAFCLLVLVAANVFCFGAYLLQNRIDGFWLGLAGIVFFVLPLGVVFIAAVAAFVRFLRQRRWGRAAAQTGLIAIALLTGLSLAAGFHELFFADSRIESDPELLWCSTGRATPLPFELRIRSTRFEWFPDPPDVRYDKRIAFPSGNRVDLERKDAEYGITAAYALSDGAFLLVDGVDAGLDRRFFRIDPAAGTVEPLAGAGDSAGRRFLGLVLPEGTFDSDAPDPLAPEGGAE
jgi:hypothetical protein